MYQIMSWQRVTRTVFPLVSSRRVRLSSSPARSASSISSEPGGHGRRLLIRSGTDPQSGPGGDGGAVHAGAGLGVLPVVVRSAQVPAAGRVPDGLLPDPQPDTEGTRRRRRVPDLDS